MSVPESGNSAEHLNANAVPSACLVLEVSKRLSMAVNLLMARSCVRPQALGLLQREQLADLFQRELQVLVALDEVDTPSRVARIHAELPGGLSGSAMRPVSW